MRRIRRVVAVAAVGVLALAATTVAAAAPRLSFHTLLTGLLSPKGLAADNDGNLIIGQGAFGPPGPVLLYDLKAGTTTEITEPLNVTDVAFGPDASGWAIGGDGVLYRQPVGGPAAPVLDIIAYQSTDPDPFDQEGNPTESNPYGLTILPSGDALVADAAGNDLIRVTPGGAATTVARFDVEAISTAHLGDPNLPPTIDAEAVPTTVTVGPDGYAYVGELKGFPFRPGTSHIWRVDPTATGAVCSVNTPDARCTVAHTNLTAIQDIDFDGSTLYVYELARDGVLAFEEGFETGEFPPAVLLLLRGQKRVEFARGRLSQPGGIIAFGGSVFVTDGMFGDGRLVQIRT